MVSVSVELWMHVKSCYVQKNHPLRPLHLKCLANSQVHQTSTDRHLKL